MSDQGERVVRWTEMSEGDTGRGRDGSQRESEPDAEPAAFSEAKLPEGLPEQRMPASGPRPAEPAEPPQPVPHDVWGKVEQPSQPMRVVQPEPEPPAFEAPAAEAPAFEPPAAEAPAFEAPAAEAPVFGVTGPQHAVRPPAVEFTHQPAPEPPAAPAPETPAAPEPAPAPEAAQPAVPPAQPSVLPAAEPADDVKVAPVPDEAPQWEGSLFDEGDGDPRYEPAVPTGTGGPARPGKPSSGNWQMPDWMADEAAADAKLGVAPAAPGAPRGGTDPDDDFGGGRGRLVLFGGVGLLVVALAAAGGVYLMKNGDDGGDAGGKPTPSGGGPKPGTAAEQPKEPPVRMPPDKQLRRFPGTPSKTVGRVADARSGLSFPKLGAPWQVPTKKNKLGTAGWSGQQVVVTERHGGKLWYGQLLTGALQPGLRSAYRGPQSVKTTAGTAARALEEQYYGFPHRTAPLASQPLPVDGHRGWLVASYLTYDRDGVKATGEIVATAVIDTGRPAPAVVFASLPNTHRKLWPDLSQFLTRLKVAG